MVRKNSRTGPAAGPVEVDGVAPFVGIAVGEILLGELLEIVAIGAEMIVDDVEDDPHAQSVGAIDETAKVVGLSIEPGGGELIDAVVTPAEFAREIRHRHDFEKRDTQFRQGRQLAIAASQVPSVVKVPMCIS